MEVAAESLTEACEFAMVHVDEGAVWEDTLDSSAHWIESVDHSIDLVPEKYSGEAIRLGGAELAARRLHQALRSLVEACDQDAKTLGAVRTEVDRAKAVLSEAPVSYFSHCG